MSGNLRLGLSPCPNDTFIFHGLLKGFVPGGVDIEPVFQDVQRLNELALAATLPVTKISAGVVPDIVDKYAILASGSALGFGCGPLVVSRTPLHAECWRHARVAVPGLATTANMLLDLHGGFEGERVPMLFSDVMDAVLSGDCDLGVIIHEGRFTYGERGLARVLDLGEWWEEAYGLPLPLGLIAVRRDVARDVAMRLQEAIAASVVQAWHDPVPALSFARQYAQELENTVLEAHIRTFVTSYSQDLGTAGRNAVERMVSSAMAARGRVMPGDGLFLTS